MMEQSNEPQTLSSSYNEPRLSVDENNGDSEYSSVIVKAFSVEEDDSGTVDSEDEESSDSSSESSVEENIEERRRRNILRHKLQWEYLMSDLQFKSPHQIAVESVRRGIVENNVGTVNKVRVGFGGLETQDNDRGMLRVQQGDLKASNTYQLSSLEEELCATYPHRETQISSLCIRMHCAIQQTANCWRKYKNSYSNRNSSIRTVHHNSLPVVGPNPIIVSGPAGTGKTSIVRHAVHSLRKRVNNRYFINSSNGFSCDDAQKVTVSEAYVDCTSADSDSVVSALNSAFRQIYECYHDRDSVSTNETNGSNIATNVREKAKVHTDDSFSRNEQKLQSCRREKLFQRFVVGENSDDEDDYFDEEEIEMERKRKRGMNQNTRKKTKMSRGTCVQQHSNKQQSADRHPVSIRSSAKRAKNASVDTTPVASFGRALASLHRNAKNNKNKGGRCAFLILDHAERILSWRNGGSTNALVQLLMLPSEMHVNLTIILISRSDLFQYSRINHLHNLQKISSTVLDKMQPINIYFEAYSSIELMKSLFQTPHLKVLITGKFNEHSAIPNCALFNRLRSKLRDMAYESMMKLFIPLIMSTSNNLTELTRLARLLWQECVFPFEESILFDEHSLQQTCRQMLYVTEFHSNIASEKCEKAKCLFCSNLSSFDAMEKMETHNSVKSNLMEKLVQNIRGSVRGLLSSAALMPGRVMSKSMEKTYFEKLPHSTKFLLLAAFLCQNKRHTLDSSLFASKGTGKPGKSAEVEPQNSSINLTSLTPLRTPTFSLERMLSVFYSIAGQYGEIVQNPSQNEMSETLSIGELGSESLFKVVSHLFATGLLCTIRVDTTGSGVCLDQFCEATKKITCRLAREDAQLIASAVGFPLGRYCQ